MFHRQFPLIAALAAALLTAAPQVRATGAEGKLLKPIQTWTDRSRTTDGRQHAPRTNVIADEKSWQTLWKAWQPDEKVPRINFNKSLILIGTAGGPNRVFLTARLDKEGNVNLVAAATKIGGTGFGYQMI